MLRWPLREILEAYIIHARKEAVEAYRVDYLSYVLQQVNSSKRLRPPTRRRIMR